MGRTRGLLASRGHAQALEAWGHNKAVVRWLFDQTNNEKKEYGPVSAGSDPPLRNKNKTKQ